MSLIRPILVLFSMMFYIAASAQTLQNAADIPFTQKDTSYWVYNFRQFRDAVYQNDIAKTKAFVDFPFAGDDNQIWFLLDGKVAEKLGDKVKPVTETDFVRYFNRLFSKEFIKCLLKIKTDELYKKGTYNTPIIEDSLASESYQMYVTFDKAENTLELSLLSKTVYKEGEDQEVAESAIIYYLRITKKGHIKLKSVALAG